MADSNIAWFGLLGAIVGAVPALIGAVVPWLRDRDRIATEKRTLELAKLEVEFVSAWIDAASKLSGDEVEAQKAIARARLYRLLGDRPSVELRSSVGPSGSAKGKGRAAFFFIYFGFYCFMVFGASIDESKNVSLSHLIKELRGDGMYAFVAFAIPLVVLLVRWLRSVKLARLEQGSA